MKKTLALIIAVAMVLGTMSGIAFADSTTVSVWDGTSYSLDWLSDGNPGGTGGDKFYLESAEELAGFAHYVNTYASTENIFTGDTVYLCVDVDLNNCEWEPIGNMTSDKRHFYGSFDGQNHTISNLKISETSGQIYGGLFGRFKGTSFSQTFSNLTLHNVNITAVKAADTSKAGAGALMGYGYDQIIDNVHVTGNISISGVSCVGGIAGQSRANISNSSVEAEGVVSGDSRVGGLVGWFISASANGYNAEIKDCSVKGNGDGLTMESGNSNAGGLVGRVNDNNGTVAIDKVGVYDVNVEVSGETVSVGAYVAPNFSKVTNAIVSNVTTSVNGEETTPSDNENVSLAVAEVDGTYYADLVSALKALKANSVLNLLSDVTIADKWDCRYTGSKILVPVTINGNGNTLKFTGDVSDMNWFTVFRFEDTATVRDLTIDVSEATTVQRGISSKGSITVDNFTFIGNGTSARYGVIFGEGAGAADIENVVVSVKNSDFASCSYGVSDNRNGQDAKSVEISDSTFTDANVLISASEEIVFDGNEIENGSLSITSYTVSDDVEVTIKDNAISGDIELNRIVTVPTISGNTGNAVTYEYLEKAQAIAACVAGTFPEGSVVYVGGTLMYVTKTDAYKLADSLAVKFVNKTPADAEGEMIYDINLVASAENIINRLNSVDLTFVQSNDKVAFEIIASNPEVAINPVDNSTTRYEFHYNGKDNATSDTDTEITIGQVKFTGYGTFTFAVDTSAEANATNVAHATKFEDNIVDTFIPNGDVTAGEGNLDLTDSTTGNVTIAVPTRELTINIAFPNEVKKQAAVYQDMKVEITGNIEGVNQTATYDLSENMTADGKYVVTEDRLVLNNAYTVTVSGAGYRTARYTVTMTDSKELNFWNNVMDEKKAVEPGKASSEVTKNFLAGDIVKDNNINIYDLSAVVSYFATTTDITAKSDYAKYDLNRDGVIDSKDVAYVLVSWGE